MSGQASLLISQSFVVSEPGSYWDYRDYIFCLCSNPSTKNQAVRLNIERGQQWLPEFKAAAEKNQFSNFEITGILPPSWAYFMLEQINKNPSTWTMPWPSDHIYINPDNEAFNNALLMGEKLGADAVAYSHAQDFEYFLDWSRVKVLYNDPNYVMIEWGEKYRYYQNPRLKKAVKKVMPQSFLMTPVPGFAVYKSTFFKEILEALPPKTTRWQDMEYSPAKSARAYKLLLPKKCLYRHVHGYWLEGFFKYQSKPPFPTEVKKEIESWYIRPNYDWQKNSPTPAEYKQMCLKEHPYFERYFSQRLEKNFPNEFGASPFDANWQQPEGISIGVSNFVKGKLAEPVKRLAGRLRKKLKS